MIKKRFTNRKKWIILFVMLLCGSSYAFLFLSGRFDSTDLSALSESPAKETNINVTDPALSGHYTNTLLGDGFSGKYNWQRGQELTYEVSYTVKINPKNPEWQIQAVGPNTKIAGLYHVRVLKTEADYVILGTQYSHVTVTQAENADNTSAAIPLEMLLNEIPILLKLNSVGRIAEYIMPDSLQNEERKLLIGMNSLQVVLPDPDGQPAVSWQAMEDDGNGTYKALYTWKGSKQIAKERVSYDRVAGPTVEYQINFLESNAVIRLSDIWFESYDLIESMEFLHSNSPIMATKCELSLKLCKTYENPAKLAQLDDKRSLVDLIDQVRSLDFLSSPAGNAWMAQQNALFRERYKNTSFEQLLDELLNAIEASEDLADRAPFVHQISDWLMIHPDDAYKARDVLMHANLSIDASSLLMLALELSAKNNVSQKVLAELLANQNNAIEAVALQAAVAAGGVGVVTSENLKESLYQKAFSLSDSGESFSISSSSLLALGILAQANDDIREYLATRLPEMLKAVDNPLATITALESLANGAIITPEIQEIALQLSSNSAHEEVRAAALEYLAKVGLSDSGYFLSALSDPSTDVQVKAIDILTERSRISSTNVAALLDTLLKPETDANTKGKIIVSLSPYKSEYPMIKDAYTALLAKSNSADLEALLKEEMSEPAN